MGHGSPLTSYVDVLVPGSIHQQSCMRSSAILSTWVPQRLSNTSVSALSNAKTIHNTIAIDTKRWSIALLLLPANVRRVKRGRVEIDSVGGEWAGG